MSDLLAYFILILLFILAIELTIVLFYAIIFMQNAVVVIKRVKTLEGDLEVKLAALESELNAISGKIIKGVIKSAGKFLKK